MWSWVRSSVEPQKAQALAFLPATSFDGVPCLKFPQFSSLCRKKIIQFYLEHAAYKSTLLPELHIML
jgi:hypothetical protein